MPNEINILGKIYLIEIFPKRFLKHKVFFNGNKVTIVLSEEEKANEAKRLLIEFLIFIARKELTKRAVDFAKEFDFKFNKIAIKEQKSRWGSCSSRGNLNFNWRLVLADQKVMDYVLIHELAHTKQMNHSKAFWTVVETCMPDYKIYRRWLKVNGKYLFTAI